MASKLLQCADLREEVQNANAHVATNIFFGGEGGEFPGASFFYFVMLQCLKTPKYKWKGWLLVDIY